MTAAGDIGGFFGLEEPADFAASGRSLIDRWAGGSEDWLGFHNARSALGWLIRVLQPPTVWLPRYLCSDVRAAAGPRLRIYDVEEGLRLSDPRLAAELTAGDLVVAVAYFGAPVCEPLRRLAARRRDVVWLEDRAQVLLADEAASLPGAWHLYSPRKLLGVHDGGVLVGDGIGRLPQPELSEPPASRADAARLRAAATGRAEIGAAYRLYLETERSHGVAPLAMSRMTATRLATVDPEPLADCRRRNFAMLDAALNDLAAPVVERLHGVAGPFGYPIRVPARDAVAARLAAEGLYCAVHWRSLVEDRPPPSTARQLAETMITLPVDHRYGEADMGRLIDGVRRAVA